MLTILIESDVLTTTTTTTTTTIVLQPFVWDYPGETVLEKKIHSLTSILIINQPLSASSIYSDP